MGRFDTVHRKSTTVPVKRLPQEAFLPADFDSGGMNLHHRPGGHCDTVAVFVHGFGGRGYKTWGRVPGALFDEGLGESTSLDVAVFDYRSWFRGQFRRGEKFDSWRDRLAGHLEQLSELYTHLALVGHSMGGVLVESVVERLHSRKANMGATVPKPISIICVSSPRSGALLASVPPFQWAWPELEAIARKSRVTRQNEEFFSSYVNKNVYASHRPDQHHIPVFSVAAEGDKIVARFSAISGIPIEQRYALDSGHRRIVRPRADDDALIDGVRRFIGNSRAGLAKSQSEGRYTDRHSIRPRGGPRKLTTRFLTDASAIGWIQMFQEVRHALSSDRLVVSQAYDPSKEPLDLLVAVHAAGRFLPSPDEEVGENLGLAVGACRESPSLAAGVCAVGPEAEQAAIAALTFVRGSGPRPDRLMLLPAQEDSVLRILLAQLVAVAIDNEDLAQAVDRPRKDEDLLAARLDFE